jgi:hypothetical protein
VAIEPAPAFLRRIAIQSFKDPSHIGGQVVHSYAVKRAAALSSTAQIEADGLQPSDTEHARQVVKIARAAAGIRKQHNRSARTVEGAFESRAADFDVSVLLQYHSPAYRRKRSVKDACRGSSVRAMMRHGGDSKGSVHFGVGGH